jgi:ribosomal protein L12E/L44/L45/RPP1/RPP2
MNQTMGVSEATAHTESLARRSVESVDRRGSESSALSLRARLIEVEAEHLRLQRLVAELLIKNKKLRELLCEQAGSSAAAASFCRGGAMQHGHASSH